MALPTLARARTRVRAVLIACALVIASTRSAKSEQPAERTIRFAWCPPGAPSTAYAMSEPADQHALVFTRGVSRGGRYPVVIAMHGQPKRGWAPRDYHFADVVTTVAQDLVAKGEVQPFVLALPVFRFEGTNWPGFDLAAFQKKISELLAAEGIEAGSYYVVGHSGAAGCGGDGMNHIERMKPAPAAVGFFDTCLGRGWQNAVLALRAANVPTLLVHSVETAGFAVRQPHEYSPTFDFGRAYAPLGLRPGACPEHLPDAPLRNQPYRCAADPSGVTRALVVDTGDGEMAHLAALQVAIPYFLREHVRSSRD